MPGSDGRGSAVSAAASVTVSTPRATNRKGPLPTSQSRPLAAHRSVTMPIVVEARKGAWGSRSTKRTVASSGASTEAIGSHSDERRPLISARASERQVATTSAARTGDPSWKRAGRRWNVHSSPWCDHPSARSGTKPPSSPGRVSPRKTRSVTWAEVASSAVRGSSEVGAVSIPMTR